MDDQNLRQDVANLREEMVGVRKDLRHIMDGIRDLRERNDVRHLRASKRITELERAQNTQAGFIKGFSAAVLLLISGLGTVLALAYNELSSSIKALATLIFKTGGPGA